MRAVFFDVDDTLYDQQAAFTDACRARFPDLLGLDAAALYLARTKFSEESFWLHAAGKMDLQTMHAYRIQKAFESLGAPITNAQALDCHRRYEQNQRQLRLLPGMARVLDTVQASGAAMGVITNGPGAHQRQKAACLGLARWFSPVRIVISGEVGVTKPEPAIFRLAEQLAPAEEYWYVGDNPVNDVQGAQNAGWRSVWFCHRTPDAQTPCTRRAATVAELQAWAEGLRLREK